ncbi:DUF108 domain-containing protein [Oceanispirochaeta crateris]|uniref:L-aspartate dehydrogenase n=1 Tax=Oceanispirochaeta crateris TaxID=2518645 RepID=A0A5C1QN80_9SPIO|nr:aspartate dehydrogenase domain-containing protein [Oceanispirochaeta crateris]QEN08679.1 DUF108 domain-containing protein [Oceanispirochaeta crateris]
MKKLAIAGCGDLAEIVVDALLDGLLPEYQLIGTMSRSIHKAEYLAQKINDSQLSYTCSSCHSVDELLALQPDYVVESSSPEGMRELALPALKNGSSIVTLSIGAFADASFYDEVCKVARENHSRVYLASGAIGGFDVMRTASLMGPCTVTFDTEKSPNSLKGTPVYDESLQEQGRKVFEGNAKEAINLFPTKVNVSVAAALASVGTEKIKVSVTSTADYVGDKHRIEVNNDQVQAVIDVYSKTPQIAGWSVVNTLRNIVSPIVF